MTIRDLFAVRWEFVKQACIGWLGGLDQVKPKGAHQVLVASGIIFLLTCRRFDMEPRRVLEIAGRMIQIKIECDSEYIRAFEEWLREELTDI